MSSKPGVFALSKSATNFVSSNRKILFQHLKVVLPLLIVCLAIQQTGQIYKLSWLTLMASFLTLFVYSCFVLSWHRTSLHGPDERNERNPFNLARDDWKFIALFCGITGAFGLVIEGLNYWLQTVFLKYGEEADETAVAAMVVFLIILAIIPFFAKASFMFPAKSVGVPLSWSETRRASKGMLWPLIGANIIFLLIVIVLFAVYGFVTTMIVQVAAGNAAIDLKIAVLVTTLIKTPVMIVGMITMALCVTALSRAYQWGIQNNDIVPDVPLKRVD